MPRPAATAVSLDSAAATVVRSARRSGNRVEVRGPDGHRLGVIVSLAELEALEDARDAAEAREVLADIASGKEQVIPWDQARAELLAIK